MNFCGVQVARGVAADEVANNGRNKQGANQNNSDVCQCDNIVLWLKSLYTYVYF